MDNNESVVISSLCDEDNLEKAIRLIQSTYWANSRSKETVLASIENSLPYFIFKDGMLIGVARVITDYSTFAYLCDVVIEPGYRGAGFSKLLMKHVLEDVRLSSVSWLLRTKDAHGLYEQFGFIKSYRPERYMEK